MGTTWGPPGTCRPQMSPMYLAIRADLYHALFIATRYVILLYNKPCYETVILYIYIWVNIRILLGILSKESLFSVYIQFFFYAISFWYSSSIKMWASWCPELHIHIKCYFGLDYIIWWLHVYTMRLRSHPHRLAYCFCHLFLPVVVLSPNITGHTTIYVCPKVSNHLLHSWGVYKYRYHSIATV